MHDTRSSQETQLRRQSLGRSGAKRRSAQSKPTAVKAPGDACRQIAVVGVVLGALLLSTFLTRPLLAAPSSQSTSPATVEVLLPVISPGASTGATLHTHIATITLNVDDQQSPIVRLDTTYDIRSDAKEEVSLPLTLANAAQFDLTLTQDGAPAPTVANEDGSATVTLAVPAGGRTELALTAARRLPEQPLLRLTYPTELLRQWRGQRSVRVELAPGSQLSVDGWLRVAPDSWRYAATSGDTQLEWLFESELPASILFQSITPAAWQELQGWLASATGNAPQAYAAVGERYRRFAAAAAGLDDGDVQERFLAQAAAAYTEGIRQAEAAGAPANELADLYAGQAALYRERVAPGDDADAPALVRTAGLALQGMMVDDPRRAELEQWQVEGLRLMLADLRRRGDIPGALALIEQLQTLPAGASGSNFLEQERQALVVEQAVQLVEQGDRTTALALAGELIENPALQPPTEYRNRFARWNVSTTMSTRGTEVQIAAAVSEGREAETQAVLESLVQTWRESPALRETEPELRRTSAEGAPAQFEIALHLPAGSNGVVLANALPQEADWALLRVLLGQLGPQIETQQRGVWEEVQVTQPIDLRIVGEQWQRIAAELDRQAAAFDASVTSGAAPLELAAAQEARLTAANYRATAQAWRELAQASQVSIALSTPGATEPAREWLITAASPPQMLKLETSALNTMSVLLAGLVALGAIFGLTAFLWRLL